MCNIIATWIESLVVLFGRFIMVRNRRDPNRPVGRMSRVNDFLPPPSGLVIPEENVKVTISLSKSSVEFFKGQAKKHHAKYQKMIRELVDTYAAEYSKER